MALPRARSLDRNYRSERALDQIQSWIQECNSDHTCDHKNSKLPSRIIHVLSGGNPSNVQVVDSKVRPKHEQSSSRAEQRSNCRDMLMADTLLLKGAHWTLRDIELSLKRCITISEEALREARY